MLGYWKKNLTPVIFDIICPDLLLLSIVLTSLYKLPKKMTCFGAASSLIITLFFFFFLKKKLVNVKVFFLRFFFLYTLFCRCVWVRVKKCRWWQVSEHHSHSFCQLYFYLFLFFFFVFRRQWTNLARNLRKGGRVGICV